MEGNSVESLGEKLKSTRESKEYTLDLVSRDTNIAGRYLEALEREDFSVFPGEAYLLGFLRNYGEYLGLSGEELLSLYRALKIQEQPIPIEQLLKSRARISRVILGGLVFLLAVGLAGGGIYFFLRASPAEAVADMRPREPAEYALEGAAMERRFYQGDAVLIPLGTSRYRLNLSGIGETLTLTVPSGQVFLDIGQEINVDLNGDGQGDIRVIATDFVKDNSAAGALLRFEQNRDMVISEGSPVEVSAVSLPPGSQPAVPAAAAATAILSSPNPYPFTLQAVFQGYCMFRWEILAERDRQGRNERYFQRTDELNLQAQNGIRIWASNAAAVKIQVIGGGQTKAVEIGGAGEVVVADVRWVRDDDGRYRLVLSGLE
jgi:cytoskeletal protein RodZ